jgi:integrase
MTLTDVLRRYCLEHDLADGSVEQLEIVVRQFDRFAGDKPVEQITADTINEWLIHLATQKAPRTVRGKLMTLRTLLSAANVLHELGPIRRVKCPANCVEAFTPEEVAKLLSAAERVPGWFGRTGIKKSDWWSAFIRTAWDTAFRLGDLLEIQPKELKDRGEAKVVQHVQHKTGRPVTRRLQPSTWEAIQSVLAQGMRDRAAVFPWAAVRYQFYVAFKKFAERAGVKGTSKYLRRARATDECRRNGGNPAAAARALGHADHTGALASRNYIDWSQVTDSLSLPPSIEAPLAPPTVVSPSTNGNGPHNGHAHRPDASEKPALLVPGESNGHASPGTTFAPQQVVADWLL